MRTCLCVCIESAAGDSSTKLCHTFAADEPINGYLAYRKWPSHYGGTGFWPPSGAGDSSNSACRILAADEPSDTDLMCRK